MRTSLSLLLGLCLFSPLAGAADTPAAVTVPLTTAQKDSIVYAYGMSAVASPLLLNKDLGETLEQQLLRWQKRLPPTQYVMVEDIGRKLYAQNLDSRSIIGVVRGLYRQILEARQLPLPINALDNCPVIGLGGGEMQALFKRAMEPAQVETLSQQHYGPLLDSYPGGIPALAQRVNANKDNYMLASELVIECTEAILRQPVATATLSPESRP